MTRPLDASYVQRRSPLPSDDDLEALLTRAAGSVTSSAETRAAHRRGRRTDRERALAAAQDQLAASAAEIKRERNRAAREDRLARLFGRRLENAAAHVRLERRRLYKMQGRRP